MTAQPFDGKPVEVLTGSGYGPGWWYFAGVLQARNDVEQAQGRPALYRKTAAHLENPLHPGVFGAVWQECSR
ncbi:MAG: hypothetical protein JWP11_1305 [Frankiales bacterium]|nr:hypothetical protein [Frankiales bacterium]